VRRPPHDRLVLGALTAFIALLFVDVLFGGKGFFARDLTFYHWPLKRIVRDTVLGGELPLWSRLIAGGQPLAANPAYEVWYPPQWLIFLPSFRLGFQLHIVFHLVLAACGTYLLLRALRVDVVPGAIGALSVALGGPLLSTTTMLPFLFAWSWAPWIALFAVRYEATGARRDFALAAAVLAMQVIIGEPTTLLQTGAILAVFAIARGPRRLVPLVALGAAACALAAVQLLPAIDFARDTVRAVPFPWQFASAWTLPPQRLIEWLLPNWFGVPQADAVTYGSRHLYGGLAPLIVSLYPGIVVALCALGGLVARVRGWLPVLVIAAAGTATATGPLFRLLYQARVFSSIRYPEKFILGPLLVMTIFGAVALHRFLEGRRAILGVLLLVAAIVDLAPRTLTLMPRMPGDYFESPSIVAPLARRPFRVAFEDDDRRFAALTIEERYRALRHDGAPNVPAGEGVAMAVSKDYDQTHLLVTRSFETAARMAEQNHSPNWPATFDAMSNVGAHVVNGRVEMVHPVQPRYVFATGVQTMSDFMTQAPVDPRTAFVQAPPFRPAAGEVRRVVERANSAEVDVVAAGPAVLLASVTADRHWHASVDGHEEPIVTANIAFQAVFVPPGAHRVRFEYRAPLVWIGAAITLLATAALIVAASRS
jgi:hypothetical protein